MRDCGSDVKMDYQVRLVTNMTAELKAQLSLSADVSVLTALQEYLGAVFTDRAHDVTLSFYDVEPDPLLDGDLGLLHQESHIMDNDQSTYTLYIPVRRYMHTALANLVENEGLELIHEDRYHATVVRQQGGSRVSPHRRGLFTARQTMDILEGMDQEFDVHLYMANCASALVLDTLGSHIRNIRVEAAGFATAFAVSDSLYTYDDSVIMQADQLRLEDDSRLCYATVNFPSHTEPDTKIIIEVDSPEVPGKRAYWQYCVYCTLADGTVTQSRVGVWSPLLPGMVKVLKGRVTDTGVVECGDATVGVSVMMDWNNGINIEFVF